jgi:hypothetical protein
MPLIAIGVAVVADVVAAGAVAATVGGIAAISTVTALEVVAAVGATISAVGAVTKNKALSLAGGVIGAVGAIGGLAAGAGLLGEAAASNAPLFGAPAAAGTADAASAGTVDTIAGAAGDTTAAGEAALPLPPPAPPGGVGSVDPATGNVITAPQVGAGAPTEATDFISAAGDTTTPPPPAAQPAATTTSTPTADATTPPVTPPETPSVPGPTGPGTEAALPEPPQPPGNVGTTDSAGNLVTQGIGIDPKTGQLTDVNPGGSGFSLRGLMDFANKNPVVAFGALQAGGSLLSGLTSTLTPAQVGALNAQAAANDAAATLTKQQTANLAMPKSVASSAPVTGAPQQLVPSQPPQVASAGLINQAPSRNLVTGAPA